MAGGGVDEGQPGGVEGGPGDQGAVLCAVEPVPRQGAAQGGHVHPNLVGAPRAVYDGKGR